MKAHWLVIGFLLAIGIFGLSLMTPIHRWELATNRAAPAVTGGYGRATVTFSDIVVHAQIPTTAKLQEQGLAGRRQLADDQGMLWIYPAPDRYQFWMQGMDVSLDFIWIADGHVVDMTPDVPPPVPGALTLTIYRPGQPVTAILEVRAGFAAAHHIQVGDQVEIDRI